MLEKFLLRRPQIEDKDQTLELMIRCDIRDVGQPDSDMSDLEYDWNQIDLSRDAWLALDAQGKLKGYGAVLPWGNGKRLAIFDDPGTEDDELFLGLLVLCEGRAASQLLETKDNRKQMVVTHISDLIEYQKKTLEDAGYELNKFIFNMHIDLDKEITQPKLPDDVIIRTARTGIDDKEIHAVIQKAFLKPGKNNQPFDEWKEFMMRADLYQSDLWFLALHGDEIVGTCLCFPYENLGWVRQLAVSEDFRNRGLGSALLRQSFLAFKERGFEKVGLAVESNNENACKLYEKVGMKKVIHLDEYQKEIDFS
jgi:ribosomal protein S18 acetylase RimI-like enzyme